MKNKAASLTIPEIIHGSFQCSDMAQSAAEAVAALHKTMVILREELARKNEKIDYLQGRLVSTATADAETCSDLVQEFHLSEDEEEQKLDSMEVSDVREHVLFIKRDIDVHWPPALRSTEKCSVSPIRPILKPPSNSSRHCTGSQTDISALSPGAMSLHSDEVRTLSAEPSSSEGLTGLSEGRNWGSEPSLVHHESKHSLETSEVKSSSVMRTGSVVKKLIIQKKTKTSEGRYSILNRNFEPLTIDITEEEPTEFKKATIDWEAFDKLKEFSLQHEGYFSHHSSSGSTDSLIDEANAFLDLAKDKFITYEDWSDIQDKKMARKREEDSCSRLPKSPFVPLNIEDLSINDTVRFIGNDQQLKEGQITNLDPVSVQDQEVPFAKIVMAWRGAAL